MGYLYVFFMILFTVVGQLLTKKGSENLVLQGSMIVKIKSMFNVYVIAAFSLTMIAPVFYILALKNLDLSVAFAFTGLNYIFVSLGGKIFFDEKLNRFHYIGMLFIFMGVGVFNH